MNGVDEYGFQPLHYAAIYGHKDALLSLLKLGANVNAEGVKDRNRTPLHYAVQRKREEGKGGKEGGKEEEGDPIVQALLEKGADIDSLDETLFTPLHLAVESGNEQGVNLLIKKGANVGVKTEEGETPVHLAAFQGSPSILKTLVKSGALLHSLNNNGKSALHFASYAGKEDAVKYLLQQKGWKVDEKDKDGYTALHYALSNGHLGVIEELVKVGKASIGGRSSSGATPLLLAVGSNNASTVKKLIELGAKVDGNEVVPKDLASLRAQINVPNDNPFEKGTQLGLYFAFAADFSPLHLAAHMGECKMIEVLVEMKANVDSRDIEGLTPLGRAICEQKVEAVKILIKRANVNTKSNMDETPLHIAATIGNEEIVKLLLANGAQRGLKTKDGETEVSLAKKYKHTKVEDLFAKPATKPQNKPTKNSK